MDFIIEHTRVGLEIPEIIALVFLVAVVVFFIFRTRKMKKLENELMDEIQDLQKEEAEMKRARYQ